MCSKKKEQRTAELEQWDLKQYPPPTSEAEILEEELAKAAHNRVRGWAKTLLECNEAYLDSFGHFTGNLFDLSNSFWDQAASKCLASCLRLEEAQRFEQREIFFKPTLRRKA